MLTKFILGSTLFISSLAFASLDEADEAYANRDGNRAEVQKALKLYIAAASSEPEVDDKIYAVEQIGRLSNYEGLLLGTARSSRSYKQTMFNNCLIAADNISPAKIGEETPAFYYIRSLCLAQWAKARGIAASISRTKELVNLLEKGRKLDASYEGGGFDRIFAALFINLPPINPFGPTRDYKLSLKHSSSAIRSAAYVDALNPAFETGNYFFNAYEYQAVALNKTGKKSQAISVLEKAISRIERGDINPDREAETKIDLKNLKKLLSDLK